jgi:hypothetical protein
MSCLPRLQYKKACLSLDKTMTPARHLFRAYLPALAFSLFLLWLGVRASVLFERYRYEAAKPLWGFSYLLVGGLLLLWLAPPLERPTLGRAPLRWVWARGRRQQVGLFLVGLGLLSLALSTWLFYQAETPHLYVGKRPWDTYALGFIALFGGFFLLLPEVGTPIFNFRAVPTLFWVIMGCALLIRLYDLPILPYGVWGDESDNALWARQVLHDPAWRPVFIPNTTGPHMFLYSLGMALFGETSITGLRMVGVAFSLAAVLLAYMVGRELHGVPFGLLMAVFMAASRWSLTFSRVAMTGIEASFFPLLCAYFLLRWGKSGSPRMAIWAGLALGTSLWFYQALRPVALWVALFAGFLLLARAFAPARGSFLRRLFAPPIWGQGLLFSLAILVCLLPWFVYEVRNPGVILGRAEQVSISDPYNREGRSIWGAFTLNWGRHLIQYNLRGDDNGRHNMIEEPHLDDVTGAFFVMGVVLALRAWRRLETWFVFGLMAVSISTASYATVAGTPHALRTMPTLAGAVYFSALGAWGAGCFVVSRLATSPLRRLTPALASLALVALLGTTFFLNGRIFFGEWRVDDRVYSAFSLKEVLMGRMAAARPPETRLMHHQYVYRSEILLEYPPFLEQFETLPLPTTIPLVVPPERPVLFYVDEDKRELLYALQAVYPTATVHDVRASQFGLRDSIWVQTLFFGVDIPPSALQAVNGLNAAGEGVLYVPYSDRYRLHFPPEESLSLNGQAIRPDEELDLPAGFNAIRYSGDWRALAWTPFRTPSRALIPSWYFFNQPRFGHGLLAKLYLNTDWAGEPEHQKIYPNLHGVYGSTEWPTYSLSWEGYLVLPRQGVYALTLDYDEYHELWLEGRLLHSGESRAEVRLFLETRPYALLIRIIDRGEQYRPTLYWAWAGAANTRYDWEADLLFAPVPQSALRPPF